MKRFLLCTLLCILAGSFAFAQEAAPRKNIFVRFWNGFTEGLFTPQVHKPFSVMGGIEGTQNDRFNLLPQFFVASDYEFSRYFGMGVRGGLTFGSKEPEDSLVSVMEGVFYGRAYLYDFGWIRPYVQTGIGISLEREMEYEYTDVLGEVATGARAHWKGWFLDTSFRYGYPFRLAFGICLGHSFLP